MSFITRLRKSAQNAARSQLSRLGIQVPDGDIPLDEDTKDRDIVDIYYDIFQKNQVSPMHPSPVPEEWRPILEQSILPICGSNEALKATVNHWLNHRDECDVQQIAPPTLDNLRTEALQMLRAASVIQSPAESLENALAEVARAQFRPVTNLIHQALKQITAQDRQQCLTDLNLRLQRYQITVIRIGTDALSLCDCSDASSVSQFWASDTAN